MNMSGGAINSSYIFKGLVEFALYTIYSYTSTLLDFQEIHCEKATGITCFFQKVHFEMCAQHAHVWRWTGCLIISLARQSTLTFSFWISFNGTSILIILYFCLYFSQNWVNITWITGIRNWCHLSFVSRWLSSLFTRKCCIVV